MRLRAGADHRGHQQVELFVRVTEGKLAQHNSTVRHPRVLALGQRLERNESVVEPLGVRLLGGQLGFNLLVGDDAAVNEVDEEHAARLQSHPSHHVAGSRSRTPGSVAMTTKPWPR